MADKMDGEREALAFALTYAMAILENKRHDANADAIKQGLLGTTLLTQPNADSEVFEPIEEALADCSIFRSVQGQALFSANSGVVIQQSELAWHLFYRAQRNLNDAIDWLFRILTTQEAKGVFYSAIWGLSVEKKIMLPDGSMLLPFSLMPNAEPLEVIKRRAHQAWNKAVWESQAWFDMPGSAYARSIDNFPYIRSDTASFDAMAKLEGDAVKVWSLLQAAVVGEPMAFGYWFEYLDRDLDIAYGANIISWAIPEVSPRIQEHHKLDVDLASELIDRFLKLDDDFRALLFRSMKRFILSQCRRETVDRILDLSLAFEICVSGDGTYAPPGWKVSVRSAQLIGGALPKRVEYREQVGNLYELRNKASHGGGLAKLDKQEVAQVLADAKSAYMSLLRSAIRLGKKPDWKSIELGPD